VNAGLAITRIPNTDYIQIDFTSDKAGLSALAANAFTEEFIRYNSSLRVARGGESVEFLKQVVDQKKAELDKKLELETLFKSNNNVLNPEGESGAKIAQLTDLENQRAIARSNVKRYELTLARLTEDIRNASSPVTGGGNQRILDLKARIDKLNDKYVTGGFKDQKLADSLAANNFAVRSTMCRGQGRTLEPV
jgi:uncharacterized protein involved in exopolysaccharide biosynthesis